MDPIHPIRPSAVQPAAIDPLRRVARDPQRDREREQREHPPKRREPAGPDAPADGAAPLAHVDARV